MSFHFSIRQRLLGSFAAILVLLFVLCWDSVSVVHDLGSDLRRAVNETSVTVSNIGRLGTALSEMKAAEAAFILFSSLNDSAQVEGSRSQFEASSAVMSQMIGQVRPVLTDANGAQALGALENGHRNLSSYFHQMTELCAAQRCNEALDLHTNKALPLIAEVTRAASALVESQKALLGNAEQEARRKCDRSYWVAYGLVGMSLVLGVGVFFVLADSARRLRGFAQQMRLNARLMSGAAEKVCTSSLGLAQGASEQADSLRDTETTAGEIASMTKRNAENTYAAAELVLAGEQRVSEANRTLEGMTGSMREINESSEKISRIIKVIEEIAFQTNILALNAAVEAARAGEAGLGFAVVADEVRGLAQRCSDAARDTTALIEESLLRSKEGSENMNRVVAAIAGITETSQKIRALVDEVNTASQEQAKGIEQVSEAVTRMNGLTGRTSSSAGESASAGQEMSAQAKAMDSMVEELIRMVDGGDA